MDQQEMLEIIRAHPGMRQSKLMRGENTGFCKGFYALIRRKEIRREVVGREFLLYPGDVR